MAAKFTASVLPVRLTAESVVRQWLLCQHGLNALFLSPPLTPSLHAEFILKRAYTHTPRIIHAIMSSLMQDHAHTIEAQLRLKPPLDPGTLICDPNMPTLPITLVHHIYHNYPTCPSSTNLAIRTLLRDERYELAKALMDCGGDPRPDKSNNSHKIQLSAKATEIVDSWNSDTPYAESCPCGWVMPQPGPMDGDPTVLELSRLRVSKARQAKINYKTTPSSAPSVPSNLNRSIVQFFRQGPCWLWVWMMPLSFDPTLGRHFCPKSQTYRDSIDFLSQLSHPARHTIKRELFINHFASVYMARMVQLFS